MKNRFYSWKLSSHDESCGDFFYFLDIKLSHEYKTPKLMTGDHFNLNKSVGVDFLINIMPSKLLFP